MEKQYVNRILSELINQYDNLNKRWENDRCFSDDIVQVFRQEEYQECYHNLKGVKFEEVILNALSNSIERKAVSRLQSLIEKNIQLYQLRQEEFNNIDFSALYILDEKERFETKLSILYHEREIIEESEYPTKQEKENLLKENQKEINLIKGEKANYIHIGEWVRKNYYAKIYALSQSFISILYHYYPKEESKIEDVNSILYEVETEYFDMELVPKIHELCNDIQLENISKMDLYLILNKKSKEAKSSLKLKEGEKIRVCYLIHRLGKTIESKDETEWRSYMLELLDIKESFYNSKYKEPESDDTNKKSRNLVSELNMILK